MADDKDEEYFLPLEDQRVFGAGIKRKRIAFVPSSALEPFSTTTTEASSTRSQDIYLSIIQKKRNGHVQYAKSRNLNTAASAKANQPLCPICHLPLPASDPGTSTATTSNAVKVSHESSIAHQVCLTHSHPPSHLDREHVGLKYLSSYGWDPDSRQGLGAKGEGIRAPVKGRIKNDTSGLGVQPISGGTTQRLKQPVIRLNAKQVREQEAAAKKTEASLRAAFYGKDLEQYLGPS